DFGLAKLLDADAGQTATDSLLGTPAYMAPEQAAGKVKEVGPAADVYALGVMLYECLTGRPPFQGESRAATLALVQHQEPVAPRRLNPAVPGDLETICMKCLEKEASRRYVTAAELAADLGRFLGNEPILARPTPARERAVKWVRRHP